MPSRPSAPSSLASSRGSSPRSNQPAISGSTLSATKLRTVSLISRSSSLSSRSMARKSSGLGVSVMVGASRSSASAWRLPGASTVLGDHRDAHDLDGGGRVEQTADLEQGGGDVVTAEVAAPDLAEALELGTVAGHVGDVDLHPYEMPGQASGGVQRGEQVSERQVELLDHAGGGDPAVLVGADLAAEEHRAAGGGQHRVREPDRRRQTG